MAILLRKHAFTLWLLAAVGGAVCFPAPASEGGFLRPELTTQLGVAVIFFLQGLSLPTRSLAAGYKPKRLHLFVLSWNYLWFPLVAGLLLVPMSFFLSPDLCVGFGLLAILPTTVASAIAFTSISGGNTANSIFSTIFSNLLGVLIVPTIAVAYLASEAAIEVSLVSIFVSLARLLVLPLVVGQVVRQFVVAHVGRISAATKLVSSGIIVFIVHAAFAESVSSGFPDGLTLGSVIAVFVGVVVLMLLTSMFIWASAAWLRVSHSQRVAAFFCASQKSLASGLPLASSVLLAAPGVVDPAAVLIPLICFHPLQLIFAGVLAERLRQ
ncbi:MAG: sodium/bile acid cotransporter 7 [Lentimonas sp.]|jgi:sodium/bile acid cotransporter 7